MTEHTHLFEIGKGHEPAGPDDPEPWKVELRALSLDEAQTFSFAYATEEEADRGIVAIRAMLESKGDA